MYRDTLNCEAVQRCLWPLDEPRPYSEQEESARMHLGHCTECREFFERDAALRRAIARYGLAARAPESLRHRIQKALFSRADPSEIELRPATTQSSGSEAPVAEVAGEIISATRLPVRLRREGWAVAAGVVAVLTAAAILHDGTPPVGEAYARDYLSHVEDLKIYSPDPAAVSQFFQQQMGVGMRPVTVEAGQLTRAMVCVLANRQAAMVEYELGGHVVAHYRIIRSDEDGDGDGRLRASTKGDVTTVTWRDTTLEHALVGDLPADNLVALARSTFGAR